MLAIQCSTHRDADTRADRHADRDPPTTNESTDDQTHTRTESSTYRRVLVGILRCRTAAPHVRLPAGHSPQSGPVTASPGSSLLGRGESPQDSRIPRQRCDDGHCLSGLWTGALFANANRSPIAASARAGCRDRIVGRRTTVWISDRTLTRRCHVGRLVQLRARAVVTRRWSIRPRVVGP